MAGAALFLALRPPARDGLRVGLWNAASHDIDALIGSGATLSIMNGFLEGRLGDPEGAERLLASA